MRLWKIFLFDYLILVSLTFIVSVISYLYIIHVEVHIREIFSGNVQEVLNLDEFVKELTELKIILLTKQPLTKSNQLLFTRQTLNTATTSLEKLLSQWKTSIHREISGEVGSQLKNEENEIQQFNKINNRYLHLKTHLNAYIDNSGEEGQLQNYIIPHINKLIKDSSVAADKAKAEFSEEAEEMSSEIHTFGTITFTAVAIILIIAFLINYFITRFVIQNLNKLRDAMSHLSMGDFTYNINIQSKNEFGDLAKSFNKMSNELQKAQASIEIIINTMPNMLVLTNANQAITKVNDKICHELGYQVEEIIEKPFQILFEKDDYITILKMLDNVEDNLMQTFSLKSYLLSKTEEKIPILFSSSKLILNKEIFYIHIAQDISVLQQMERELVATARKAGMAEVSTSVLHNVGNILNSVKTSIDIVQSRLEKKSTDYLAKIANLLIDKKENLEKFLTLDSKGKSIPEFLLKLSKLAQEEKLKFLEELNNLKVNVNHITTIISSQQQFGSASTINEDVNLAILIQEILNLDLISTKDNPIKVIQNLNVLKIITIDKVKLMQVLVNFVKNAFDAMLESPNIMKILTISATEKDDKYFIITISDTGIGIPPDKINRIFNFGFTTKPKGHGYGLHSSALAIKDMGGEISVNSNGLNKGTQFTIILPFKPIK